MIREAKSLLESVIKEAVPGVTVVKSAADESRQIGVRKFPLVSLITLPGTFDESEARVVRYYDETGQYKGRYVRGYRNLPIVIRCWAEGEDAADAAASAIMPCIPSQWVYDGFTCRVELVSEEHSDHAGNASKLYVSAFEVCFNGAATRKPDEIPVVENVQVQYE